MSYLVREIDELQRKVRGHERVASAMARRIDELENELMDYRQTYGEIEQKQEEREAA
jgi:chromosome segregation ATPase